MPARVVADHHRRGELIDRPQALGRLGDAWVIFRSFIGPGVSALNMVRPPMPSSGRMAIASTIRPMPPIHTKGAATG